MELVNDVDIKSGETKGNGEVCPKQRRSKRQKALLKELLLDYTKNSTLHGLRYISEGGLSVIEKIFWLLTFIISVAICFLLIRNVWIKWQNSPVIVTVSEKLIPVAMVPFPSVTICPQVKCLQSIYNYSEENRKFKQLMKSGIKEYSGDTLQSLEFLQDIRLVCDRAFIIDDDLLDSRTDGNSSIVDHILAVAPKDIIASCTWRGMDCTTAFRHVLTSEGVCFSFNALAADEIFNDNIQKDYTYLNTSVPSKSWPVMGGFDPSPYPRRGRENGLKPDLEVVLSDSPGDRDITCNTLNTGFKIYIQNPADLPQPSHYYYAASPGQVTSMALSFNVLNTSDSLRDYPPEVRQCYFPSDRPLRYFRTYTENNCRLECLSEHTFKHCGCVMFYMPHNDSRSICTAASRGCVKDAQVDFTTQKLKANLGFIPHSCRCLSGCQNVHYEADVHVNNFDYESYLKKKHANSGLDYIPSGQQYSKIEMFYKAPRFVSMLRSELFGVTDFLANCGGLLSLFLGFSFLSLVEIAYFISLRLFCKLKTDKREQTRAEMTNDDTKVKTVKRNIK